MTPTDKQNLWNAILKLNNKPYIGSGYGAYNNVKNPALRGGLYTWKYRDMRELYEQLVKYCELGEYEATWRVLQGYKTKIYPAYLRKIYQTLNCAVGPSVPGITTSVFPNANIIGGTVGGGNVTYDGGSAVTARGVCYSTSPNPTLADSFTVDGTGTGAFISNIDLLPLDSIYYIRAYATNSTGTGYGNQRVITTPPSFVYVGSQYWSTKNLTVDTYRNGDPIPFAANSSEWLTYNSTQTGAWRYYNDDPSTELIYGKYYNSYAMQDSRILAPNDYHIPTRGEWNVLNNYLISQSQSMANLKNISLNVWTAPNTSANNAYLFEAMPTGAIGSSYNSGTSYNMASWGYQWIYTQYLTQPNYAFFGYDGTCAPMDANPTFPGQGMAVRIIDNASLVRGQLFGGGFLLENISSEGITAFAFYDVNYNYYEPSISNFVIGDEAWGPLVAIGANDSQRGYDNTQIMGSNSNNSISMLLAAQTGFAADNKYYDWYIPASDEVLIQIQQVPEYEMWLDPFKEYWTSTEQGDDFAFAVVNRSNTPGGSNWELQLKDKYEIKPFLGMRRQIL
jgi:uncharacterized protein (TIGR02145 family)